jgi:hypothetical protein
MNNTVKIGLYVFLTILASISGYYAFASFSRLMERSGDRISELERIEPVRTTRVEDVPATNVTATTNPPVANTNQAALAEAPGEITPATPTALGDAQSGSAKPKSSGRLGLWTALFVVSIIALGLLIASDVSHYFGNRALKTLYNEEGEGVANPEYEQAEQAWANGKHLEAISIMRGYLNKNPREQHVAIRIAEIYEKDLGNHLAAALEYEEVLKHNLAPERWGWAAIHLCNLYFKLGQELKAYPLLRRIVNEFPTTPAADKARKRLEQVEGAASEPVSAERPAPRVAEAPANNSGLPPGFRPRK